MVARFDEAVSAGDLGGMSECARIMAEFRQGESQLVQASSCMHSVLAPAPSHELDLQALHVCKAEAL